MGPAVTGIIGSLKGSLETHADAAGDDITGAGDRTVGDIYSKLNLHSAFQMDVFLEMHDRLAEADARLKAIELALSNENDVVADYAGHDALIWI